MQSSKHIGTIVRNHAKAVENGKASARPRKAKTSASSFSTVPRHRAFVPMVTIWAGVFMALIMAVMPEYAIARSSALTGIYLPLIAVRIILAIGVGCAGALLGYIVSSALANYVKKNDVDNGLVSKAFRSRDLEPINPVVELGSESLDAPILEEFEEPALETAESAPRDEAESEIESSDDGADNGAGWAFTRKHFKHALIESCEGATCEPATCEPATCEPAPGEEPVQPQDVQTQVNETADAEFASLSAEQINAPRRPVTQMRDALDLAGFSSLPEDPQEAQTPREEAATDIPAPAPTTGLEALRQKPAEDLSLVEMVERFAAALHDRQTQERARFERGQKNREAALADALKALTLFTENGFDQGQAPSRNATPVSEHIDPTEDELRSALTRLQGLRGAA
ncbi:hypothetical protein MWU38_07360 [Qipengyuania sp. S6317L1]|uniref:hypothetical protein n=1 Tax=Qipengyuania sp. S6317L1 TaxID=2926410 RepID=UPI001FF61975|nr:hypothetical protein [Qipengyuania sp. S6317L1]MCK0099195.1 hypothetical protein [Qipengyuania sp. S6317L1]